MTRNVGEGDVAAWHVIAVEEHWTWPRARRAAINYHRRDGDRPRIKPAHITDAIAAARKLARARFTEDVCPPRELADDPRAEIAWRRQRAVDWIGHALDAWTETGEIPTDLPQRRELGDTERPALMARHEDYSERFAVNVARDVAGPADANDRRRMVEQARVELAQRPAAPLPATQEAR